MCYCCLHKTYRNTIPSKCGWIPQASKNPRKAPSTWLTVASEWSVGSLRFYWMNPCGFRCISSTAQIETISGCLRIDPSWGSFQLFLVPTEQTFAPEVWCHRGAEFGRSLVCSLQDGDVGWPSVQCVSLPLPLHLHSSVLDIKPSARNILVCVLYSVFIDVTAHKERARKNVRKKTFKAVKSC